MYVDAREQEDLEQGEAVCVRGLLNLCPPPKTLVLSTNMHNLCRHNG